MFGFTLNSAVTSVSLGLRLTASVAIPAATRTVDDIEVEGRAGTLTRFTGWEDTEIELELAVPIRDGLHQYRKAAHELTGASTIALTAEPGVYRKVKHCEVSELRRELSGWGFFTARLTCQPFSYLSEGLKPVTMSESGTITNPGLLDADPIITVTGMGMLSLTVNKTVHQVNSPVGSVTLDSARLVAHVSGRVQADALTETFPTFKPGVNRITLGTGISQVLIVPNWRNP
ncbi:Phage-related protein [Chlamydia trachomatis]|nr:Phage-related protein [Chlamydia trachomatis]CRH89896.1 Phage-related protein [Chlamydia trachomatis]